MERFLNSIKNNYILEKLSKKYVANYKRKNLIASLQARLQQFFLKNEKIEFPLVNNPDISVILVLYNQAQFTLECLRLLQKQQNITFEVIVIDNASTDSTHQLLNYCHNVLVIKNANNIGFLQAANQGAKAARGKSLLFLNNDIWRLNSDAFSIALETLHSDKKIGIVGGKIILPDGLLQEAGVFVTQKGIHQYGRGKKPDIFEVNFQRHVDYCSGLFLMTPKDLFHRLGGFDLIYSPAYCEDCDYGLRVNQAGYKVIYEPRIVVGHIEGGSSVKKGDARALYEKNIILFQNKHKEWLQTIIPKPAFSGFTSRNVIISRFYQRNCRRILFIGNSISPSQHVLDLMKQACDSEYAVTYYSLDKFELAWDKIFSLFDIRIEVCKDSGVDALDRFIRSRKNYYSQILDENGNLEKWSKYSQFLESHF